MAATVASSVQSHSYQLSSGSTCSSSHLLLSFSRCLAYSQFHRTFTAFASWPLKQNIDAPKSTKIKTKSPSLKKEKPKPTPKRKPDVSKLLDRSCNGGEVPAIQLYARRHFLFPPLSINEYNRRVMALVCCETQDTLLKELLKDDFLSEEERDVIRWGRNIESGKTRTTRRAGAAVYNRASSLETLVGYLYLTNANRLDTVMRKLGFYTDHIVPTSLEGLNCASTIPAS